MEGAPSSAPSAKKVSRKTLAVWGGIAAFILFEILVSPFVHPTMNRVTEHAENLKEIFGVSIPFGGVNMRILINSWIVMGLMILLGLLGRFRLTQVPGRRQGFFELVFELFQGLCRESLGERLGRRYTPYLLTLFFFILISNWFLALYLFPWIEEPTISLNMTVALGTIAFLVSHGTAIKEKGFLHYLAHYFEPMIEIGPLKIPNLLFFPIHLIGEVGKVISHSFRLFGNILGGAIIYVVVSALVRNVFLPPGLVLFLGFFIGTIQAFVFTLLALTYITILVGGEEEAENHAH
jgi:F-type H+-transporting ATPase subunit a